MSGIEKRGLATPRTSGTCTNGQMCPLVISGTRKSGQTTSHISGRAHPPGDGTGSLGGDSGGGSGGGGEEEAGETGGG